MLQNPTLPQRTSEFTCRAAKFPWPCWPVPPISRQTPALRKNRRAARRHFRPNRFEKPSKVRRRFGLSCPMPPGRHCWACRKSLRRHLRILSLCAHPNPGPRSRSQSLTYHPAPTLIFRSSRPASGFARRLWPGNDGGEDRHQRFPPAWRNPLEKFFLSRNHR